MIKIYYSQKYNESNSRELLSKALNLEGLFAYNVDKSQRGKPFLVDDKGIPVDLFFNISHSEKVWCCCIGSYSASIDIELKKNKNFYKISDRYFTEKEKEHIYAHEENFYSIWRRKECLSKLLDRNLYSIFSEFETVDNNGIIKEGSFVDKTIYFADVRLNDRLICTLASHQVIKQVIVEEI